MGFFKPTMSLEDGDKQLPQELCAEVLEKSHAAGVRSVC